MSASPGRSAAAARVDSLVAAYRREHLTPGASVAAVRGGRDTVVLRGYGLATLEHGVPATPETVYRVVGHGAGTEGFLTRNVYLPDDSPSVTVLTNLGSESPALLLVDIARAVVEPSQIASGEQGREAYRR